jgi:hypothetical protein
MPEIVDCRVNALFRTLGPAKTFNLYLSDLGDARFTRMWRHHVDLSQLARQPPLSLVNR